VGGLRVDGAAVPALAATGDGVERAGVPGPAAIGAVVAVKGDGVVLLGAGAPEA
jgi:hypothetical protein